MTAMLAPFTKLFAGSPQCGEQASHDKATLCLMLGLMVTLPKLRLRTKTRRLMEIISPLAYRQLPQAEKRYSGAGKTGREMRKVF